jgi:hypothetical protein
MGVSPSIIWRHHALEDDERRFEPCPVEPTAVVEAAGMRMADAPRDAPARANMEGDHGR